jgi:hypothetical protein
MNRLWETGIGEDVVGKFGLSATEIGLRIGATPMEVNRLLKDQGFLDGEPGAYGLTPKGKEFGVQRSHDNGYGGIAYRPWETTHFDSSITQVLDSTPEKLAKVRVEISAAKLAQQAASKIAQAESEAKFHAFQAEKEAAELTYEIDPRKVLLVVAGVVVAVGTAIGVYKGVQWYRRMKAEKAAQAESDLGSGMPARDEGK